jgi:hypothetical protein
MQKLLLDSIPSEICKLCEYFGKVGPIYLVVRQFGDFSLHIQYYANSAVRSGRDRVIPYPCPSTVRNLYRDFPTVRNKKI